MKIKSTKQKDRYFLRTTKAQNSLYMRTLSIDIFYNAKYLFIILFKAVACSNSQFLFNTISFIVFYSVKPFWVIIIIIIIIYLFFYGKSDFIIKVFSLFFTEKLKNPRNLIRTRTDPNLVKNYNSAR